jgi:hypothetical protein
MAKMRNLILFACLCPVALGGCDSRTAGPNRAPVAVAGPDRVALVGARVELDAVESFDPDGDSIVMQKWSLLATPDGSVAFLENDDQSVATLTPDVDGMWLVQLRVTDGKSWSEPDTAQVRVVVPCEDDSDCDDQDVCTGFETCVDGMCRPGQGLVCEDGDPCTDDECDPVSGCHYPYNNAPCDDGDPCTMEDTCGNGSCHGVPLDNDRDGYVPEGACGGDDCDDTDDQVHPGVLEIDLLCEDGIDNDCDGSTDDEQAACRPCTIDADCDDQNVCNGIERCVDLACESGDPLICEDDGNPCMEERCDPVDGCYRVEVDVPCEDGNECTTGDNCSGGQCQPGSPVLDATACNGGAGVCCLGICQAGECCIAADCDDQNVCTTHQCNAYQCEVSFPSGPCDDGATCTGTDQCFGGECVGVPDDVVCPEAGQLCRPKCFGAPSGCGWPPDSLSLTCTPGRVDLDLDPASQCEVDLGLAGQENCLFCAVEAGLRVIDFADFGDDGGICDLDGWRLAPGINKGEHCRDSVSGCNQGGGTEDCCDELADICDTLDGSIVLKTDEATNCGIKKEEWRLTKTFDFSGLWKINLCLDVAARNATGDEGILVYADDEYHDPVRVFCQIGQPHPGVNSFFYRDCSDILPDWAENNPAVTLQIIAHSENANEAMYLDNVSVRGWPLECDPGRNTVLEERFDGCDTSQWQVVNANVEPTCPSGVSCTGDSEALATDWDTGSTWEIRRRVDASTLDADVELCFDVGDWNADDSDEYVLVQIDTGSGWQTVWSQDTQLNEGANCSTVCVNLSEIDPLVNRNPDLGIGFTLAGEENNQVLVDDIVLSGARHCAVPGNMVELEPFALPGQGRYTFAARNVNGEPLATDLVCSWDSPPAGQSVWDAASVWYREWWDTNWTRRSRLTFLNQNLTAPLEAFPVLVILDESRVDYTHTKPGGEDLRFIDPDGSELPYEIEKWNPNGFSYVWVGVPRIEAHPSDDYIYLYYGYPDAAASQSPQGVWDPASFRAVWHLREDLIDSTGNTNDGVNQGSLQAAGVIANARYFDGGSDFVDAGNDPSLDFTGGLSVEAWVRPSSVDGNHHPVVTKGNHTWGLKILDDDKFQFFVEDGQGGYPSAYSNNDAQEGRWVYLVGVFDTTLGSNNILLYVNGVLQSDKGTVASIPIDGYDVHIGHNSEESSRYFVGTIDEVRLSSTARSAEWIDAQQHSMTDRFVLYGAKEAW